MQKKNIKNILIGATTALLIPIFGKIFLEGWNWGVGDFVFAWVFFVTLGLTYKFITGKISNPNYRTMAGIAIVGIFTAVWVLLATG